jgi:hypothetical protein
MKMGHFIKLAGAVVVCMTGTMGCHSGYNGYYTSAGAQCGSARPGCDYYSDAQTKITVKQDPAWDGDYYDLLRNGGASYFSTVFNQNVVQTPVGLIYSTTTLGALNSVDSQTKDVDMMRADLQTQNLTEHAQAISARFQMNIEAATKLAMLSDKIQQINASGAPMTQESSQQLAYDAFSIAGLNPTDVNSAILKSMSGDNNAEETLLNSAADSLGMPSVMLKSQLLPALGIQP